ncbi:hypothetical protein MPTK1_8g00730 [Marchantia polymorpha subsp. ruderalis]|uniref:Secreted protein n=1 Tax=Marchantia polymorpha TaxID=3197 RepID=A0A2R6WLD0_MARPO|nr:hypothetical protein MARPO_0077s0002 [Marchantia polymorpha]BBN18220.1 hypothetical protein Mp_8g00730 [Marchantia polymorpha subsp. ruderalis]|eukprot:PTQ34667.1 hypothetical protein MARPO_0077s0002 [Marchantia polymorpha]
MAVMYSGLMGFCSMMVGASLMLLMHPVDAARRSVWSIPSSSGFQPFNVTVSDGPPLIDATTVTTVVSVGLLGLRKDLVNTAVTSPPVPSLRVQLNFPTLPTLPNPVSQLCNVTSILPNALKSIVSSITDHLKQSRIPIPQVHLPARSPISKSIAPSPSSDPLTSLLDAIQTFLKSILPPST